MNSGCRFAFVSLVALGSVSFANASPEPVFRIPMPETRVLSNGVRAAWLESDAVPVVDFVLLSESGSRHDPVGRSGISSLAVAAWRRTDKETAIRRLGASWGAAFDGDQVTLNVEGFASDRWELLRDFLGSALRPDFDEADVRTHRERLAAAWTTGNEQPDEIVQAFFERLLLRNTSYWRGGMAGPRELKSIMRADLVDWHRRLIEPARVVLLGTGPGKTNEFFAQSERLIGELGWKASAAPASVPGRSATPGRGPAWLSLISQGSLRPGKQKKIESPRILLVDRPEAPQAHVRIGTRAPAFGDPDRIALGLANGALGETFDSRLNREVRDGIGLVYGISSGFAWMREAAFFGVSFATPPQAAGIVLAKTLEVLADAGTGNFTSDEIDKARLAGMGSYPLQFTNNVESAMRWLATFVDGRSPGELVEFPSKLAAVTVETVNEVARRHWGVFSGANGSPAWIVVAGDANAVRESLQKAGFPKSSIVGASFEELESLSR